MINWCNKFKSNFWEQESSNDINFFYSKYFSLFESFLSPKAKAFKQWKEKFWNFWIFKIFNSLKLRKTSLIWNNLTCFKFEEEGENNCLKISKDLSGNIFHKMTKFCSLNIVTQEIWSEIYLIWMEVVLLHSRIWHNRPSKEISKNLHWQKVLVFSIFSIFKICVRDTHKTWRKICGKYLQYWSIIRVYFRPFLLPNVQQNFF